MAEGATTCLMCGTALDELPEVEAEDTQPQRTRRLSLSQGLILAVMTVVILGISIVIGLRLSQGGAPTAQELPTFTPSATLPPTATSSPTLTATPTDTPTPEPTPTPIPPIEYIVQPGDTLLGIALEHNLTVAQILAANDRESDLIIPGERLLLPPPTPTPGPTPTPDPDQPTPTHAPYVVHTVRDGDTLSTIAQQYGITMAVLREANDIPPDTETIRVDQVLIIPQFTPTPEPTATPTPSPVGPAQPGAAVRYASPPMLYPADGATFYGAETTIVLQWASVGILSEREFYHVEFNVPTEEGRTTVDVYLKSTAWRVPTDLFPADEVEQRVCTWRVSVVRQITEGGRPIYREVSPAAQVRTLTWLPAQED